jgi:metal-sulfur cluster biosynthetic enzyme
MGESLPARVTAALAGIRNPRLENDLISAGMVRDLSVTDDGKVSFTFLLSREDPATLVRDARAAVRAVEGVSPQELRISVVDPRGPAPSSHAPPQGAPLARRTARPAWFSAAAAGRLSQPRRIIASLRKGRRRNPPSRRTSRSPSPRAEAGRPDGRGCVRPNIPRMFGVFEKPPVDNQKIQPSPPMA